MNAKYKVLVTARSFGTADDRALRLLEDLRDAEECVSDALLAAWNTIPPRQPEKLSAYLARLTRNLALKRRRDAGRLKRGGGEADRALEELDECVGAGRSVEETVEQRELAAALERFLRALPATERRVFLARYWYFESTRETAARFGFSESKLRSMLSRTRRKLRRYLEEEGLTHEE